MNGSLLIHEESIQTLTENLSDAVIVVQDDNIVHANHATARMHGYDSVSEIIGTDIFSFGIQDKDKEKLAKVHEKSKAGLNTGKTFQWNLKARDGRIFRIEGRPNRIIWNGRTAVLNVVYDLTRPMNNWRSTPNNPINSSRKYGKSQSRYHNTNSDRLKIIGKSKAMEELYEMIIRASMSDANVLILGESGSGKEIAARLIHDISNRYRCNFVAMNCTAINENLFESEFFGHKKGSFTGALSDRAGYFSAADGGTLFLDEIGDLTLEAQKKLLRVFDRGEYTPVGCVQPRKVNARIIMATNKDPFKLVEQGLMREDFFYRIYIIVLHVPPLRERMEDLPILMEHFLEQSNFQGTLSEIPDEIMKNFKNYHWPGNVRELQNALTRYITLGHVDCIPPNRQSNRFLDRVKDIAEDQHWSSVQVKMKPAVEAFEKMMILEALNQTKGNKARAAEILDIPRRTFFRKIQAYGIL